MFINVKNYFSVAILLVIIIGKCKSTDRPIIGILTQEININTNNYNKTSYIPATYIKAVEASGGRVVPISIGQNEDYYRKILTKINGVLLPGGGSNFWRKNGFSDATKFIYKIVIEMNLNGDSVPILGICQGLELLAVITNEMRDLLTFCNVIDINLSLKFKPWAYQSRLYKNVNNDNIYILKNFNLTVNHHKWCVTEKILEKYNLLNTVWQVLTTSFAPNGLQFVSSMIRTNLPIAAVQFHPEKNIFDWQITHNIPHSDKAISGARVFYDWLIEESKLNNHSFNNITEEIISLIYNYQPVYDVSAYDLQVYYFD